MKISKHKVFPVLGIAIGISAIITGCKKDNDTTPSTGAMEVKMTDAPGDFLEVNVDVKQIRFRYSGNDSNDGSGWMDLPTQQGIYNLLSLQNGITETIADTNIIPTGRVSQIRLILGDSNTVMRNDSTVYPLFIPSAYTSGLKIQTNAEILADQKTIITIDFDAGLSIKEDQSSGGYRLEPVVKLKNTSYSKRK